MPALVAFGDLMNHLERCGGVTGNIGLAGGVGIVTSSASSLYPKTYLYDRWASNPFLFNAAAADDNITIDLNLVTNGGFESGVTGWTDSSVGASNAGSAEAVIFNDGAGALKLTVTTTGGSNKAERYRDITVRAGEYLNPSVALRGDGTRTVRARLYIPSTGQYVTSAGALTTTPTDFATRSTATFATTAGTEVRMPTFAVARRDTFTLRLIVYMDGSAAGVGYADSFYVWPSVDFFSLAGHNIDPVVTVQLNRDTAAFAGAGTLEQAVTVYRPSFYHALGTRRTDRYWQVKFSGTNTSAIYVGELVLTQKLQLTYGYMDGLQGEYANAQVRSTSDMGDVQVFLMSAEETRHWVAPFDHDETSFEELRDVLRRSALGAHPIIFVPDSTDAEVCIYGRVGPQWSFSAPNPVQFTGGDLDIYESPFPTFVA